MDEDKDLLKGSFSEFEGNAKPKWALEQMESKGMDYCVVFDPEGVPIALANCDDVRVAIQAGAGTLLDPSAAFPPTILTPPGMDAWRLASDPTVSLLEFGARGAIVMSGRTVKGIVPANLVLNALASGEATGGGRLMGGATLGDIQLGGVTNTPVGRVVCRTCGFVNEVYALDPGYLPNCQNPLPPPHTLKVR